MANVRVKIPYISGESKHETLRRIMRECDNARDRKGWRVGGYRTDREYSEVADALLMNKRDQTITLT